MLVREGRLEQFFCLMNGGCALNMGAMIGFVTMFGALFMMVYTVGKVSPWRPSYEPAPEKPYKAIYCWAVVFFLGIALFVISVSRLK